MHHLFVFFRLFLTREFAVFLIVGGISSLVNILCGFILYNFHLLPYAFAVFMGAMSGLVVNFILNYLFTFHYRGRNCFSQFNTFFIVAILGTILTAITAKAGLIVLQSMDIEAIRVCNLVCSAELIAHAFSVGVITFYSYIGHKYCSFNDGLHQRFREIMLWFGKPH